MKLRYLSPEHGDQTLELTMNESARFIEQNRDRIHIVKGDSDTALITGRELPFLDTAEIVQRINGNQQVTLYPKIGGG